MSEKMEFIKEGIGLGEKLFSYFDDPHGIKELLLKGIENTFEEISNNPEVSGENKLMFFAEAMNKRKTRNVLEIVKAAIPFLEKEKNKKDVDNDWLMDFFDKASKIETEDIKKIWARILAEEINNPNTISKRLLHNLFLMSRKDASNFLNFSRFCFYDRTNNIVHPVIFIRNNSMSYKDSKITTEILKELEQFSLIEINYETGFSRQNKLYLLYTNHYINIVAPKIKMGNVRLTADGQKLFQIIKKCNNNQILEYTVQLWQYEGYEVKIETR